MGVRFCYAAILAGTFCYQVPRWSLGHNLVKVLLGPVGRRAAFVLLAGGSGQYCFARLKSQRKNQRAYSTPRQLARASDDVGCNARGTKRLYRVGHNK